VLVLVQSPLNGDPANPGSWRDRQTVAEPEERAPTQWITSLDQVRLAVLETSGPDQLHPD